MVLCYCALAFASGGGGGLSSFGSCCCGALLAHRVPASRADRIDALHGCTCEALGAAGDGFYEPLRCQTGRGGQAQKTAAAHLGLPKHGSPCPPLGVGDLGRSPSNAKAAISPNRAAIARRAGPRVSHDSPYPSINPRDVHSPPSTAKHKNAESRAHHPNSRPPRRPSTALGSPRDPSHGSPYIY